MGYGYGLRLKVERIKRNLTQEQLAKKAGVTGQTISHYEREQREPRLGAMISIAAALDTTVQELFFQKED